MDLKVVPPIPKTMVNPLPISSGNLAPTYKLPNPFGTKSSAGPPPATGWKGYNGDPGWK